MSEEVREAYHNFRAAIETMEEAKERFTAIATKALAVAAATDQLRADKLRLDAENDALRERIAVLEQEVFNARGYRPE
jgi:predicted  nucleic acid-binding Zn-ribbon protein